MQALFLHKSGIIIIIIIILMSFGAIRNDATISPSIWYRNDSTSRLRVPTLYLEKKT